MPEEETCPERLEPKPARKSFDWPSLLLAGLVISSLAGLTSPMVIRAKKKSPQTEATSNIRQIGLALHEFETEYGSYPSDATAAIIIADYPEHGHDFLRIDNSATSLPIGKDGRVLLNGIDILSAENPIWDGKAPDIRYPE